jgi:formylglycine-generating enzyme required for sulfatase activity/serine/threonine protein kinase
MSGSQFDQRRQRALDLRLSGQCTKAEYDEMMAEIDRLQAASAPVPQPAYIPGPADRDKGTVAGIPIPPALKAGTLLDKYELKSSKRGGMGEVWKAWDAKADRWVAVKLLPQELRGNIEEIARIRSQFKLVEQLDHPHICRLFDLNEHPVWGWYEVMRWIDGETLAEIAAKAGGKLPYERVVRLLWPVARALDHAHARNVLHRDIKPLNIMEDGEGKVHVIDFGLAAEVRGSLSRVSRKSAGLSGTPQYLAPELWNEAPESAQSDQYALGITAYELLAGRPPFKTDNLAILMARIQTADVQSIAGLHGDAMAVIWRSLAKQPNDRFGSCTEFLKTLANPPRVTPFQPSPVPHDSQEATQIPELPAASRIPSEQSPSNQSEQHRLRQETPNALTRSLGAMSGVASPQISPIEPEVSESPAAPINPLQIPFDQRGSWPAMLKSPVNKAKAPRWLRDWATGLDSLRGLRPRLSYHWMRAILIFLALSVVTSIGVIWFDGSRKGQPIKAVADTSPPSPTTVSGAQPAPLRSPFSQSEAEAGQRAWAAYLGRGYEMNSLGMELALIPPGSFQMGSPESEPERCSDEGPVSVTLTRPYWLGRTEVTRKQWKGVMGTEPWGSQSGTEDHPATKISWDDGVEFCRRLTERDGGAWTYRLPTEAEWEWACRGGTLKAYWFGNKANGSEANCDGNHPYGTSQQGPYKEGTTAVGNYGANQFGLWDMHGNVSEWCADLHQGRLTGGENPEVTSGGSYRVFRGGGWYSGAVYCRSAFRDRNVPRLRLSYLGFRVLAIPSPR